MSEERAVLPKEVQPSYLVTGKAPKHTHTHTHYFDAGKQKTNLTIIMHMPYYLKYLLRKSITSEVGS